jgi:hypothetical protein
LDLRETREIASDSNLTTDSDCKHQLDFPNVRTVGVLGMPKIPGKPLLAWSLYVLVGKANKKRKQKKECSMVNISKCKGGK